MTDKFMSLDEIFKQEEARLSEENQASRAALDAKMAERARIKAMTPVWMAAPDKTISGPYANEDAAIEHAEKQGWNLDDVIIDTKEEWVRSQLAQAAEPDDEEEDEEDDPSPDM